MSQVNPAEKAALLSASISIAMNNTAFALMVAIPFLLIHSFLQAPHRPTSSTAWKPPRSAS